MQAFFETLKFRKLALSGLDFYQIVNLVDKKNYRCDLILLNVSSVIPKKEEI
jgi:hypothetical protein